MPKPIQFDYEKKAPFRDVNPHIPCKTISLSSTAWTSRRMRCSQGSTSILSVFQSFEYINVFFQSFFQCHTLFAQEFFEPISG